LKSDSIISHKSYRNLKIAGFLDLFFFFESTTNNFDREYPNFDSETAKKKTTKNSLWLISYSLIVNGLCSENPICYCFR